jgi:hypothetical protein
MTKQRVFRSILEPENVRILRRTREHRNKGRRRRWEDVFKEKCGPEWRRQVRDRDRWWKLGEAYAAEATYTCQ